MKKTLIAAAIASLAATQAFSATYDVTGNAGSTNVDSSGTVILSYGSPSANPPLTGSWDVDTTTGSFSGNIYLGDYSTDTSVSLGIFGSMSGTVTYTAANHDIVGGTGSFDAGTNTFTYSIPLGASNSNAASNFTGPAPTCVGSGSVAGNTVCGTAGNTTPSWEGIEITLTFAPDLSSFTGDVAAFERSGSGLTANTTTLNYSVAGTVVNEVPVPAAAWLFGSALLGLGQLSRKKKA